MFIAPTNNETLRSSSNVKRKQNAGESTFAEEVESLLEVDAVDLSKDRKEENEKRGFSKLPLEVETEAEDEEVSPRPAAPVTGGLNIRA